MSTDSEGARGPAAAPLILHLSSAGHSPTSTISTYLPEYTPAGSRPPRYSRLPRPQNPLTFIFTNWHANTMYLIPQSTPSASPAPSFVITVNLNLNPFLPVSYVTRIERSLFEDEIDDDEDGFVGEFEISLNQQRAILTMEDMSVKVSNVLLNVPPHPRVWEWRLGRYKLRWDCRTTLEDGSPMCICFSSDPSATQLATFVPPSVLATPPLPDPVLTVFPDGTECFDHILVSALIIERKLTMSF